MRLLRAIVGGITGLILAGSLGATVFGLSTYINATPTSGWVELVAFVSGIICGVGGLVLGLLVGIVHSSKRLGMLLGSAFALVFVIYALSDRWLSDSKLWAATLSLLFIAGGALVGLLAVMVSSLVPSKRRGLLHP